MRYRETRMNDRAIAAVFSLAPDFSENPASDLLAFFLRPMIKSSTHNTMFTKTLTASLLVFLAASRGALLAQEKPERVSSERARANFGRPVVLAADDVRAFADAPVGFDNLYQKWLLCHPKP